MGIEWMIAIIVGILLVFAAGATTGHFIGYSNGFDDGKGKMIDRMLPELQQTQHRLQAENVTRFELEQEVYELKRDNQSLQNKCELLSAIKNKMGGVQE